MPHQTPNSEPEHMPVQDTLRAQRRERSRSLCRHLPRTQPWGSDQRIDLSRPTVDSTTALDSATAISIQHQARAARTHSPTPSRPTAVHAVDEKALHQ
jgi:hypothetical protein